MRRSNLALLLVVVGLLVWSAPAVAQVALDGTVDSTTCTVGTTCTGGSAGAGTTATLAHTTGSGSNRAMVAATMIGCNIGNTQPSSVSVTYATSQALTKIESIVQSSYTLELWALPAGTQPTSGSNNLVAVWGATGGCSAISVIGLAVWTATGVDQTTTFTDTNIANGTSTTAAVTLTGSGATDLGFGTACVGTQTTSTTETSQFNIADTVGFCSGFAGSTAAGGDTSFSFTLPSDTWIMAGGAFKAASGGGGTPCVPRLSTLGVSQCGD